MALPFIRRRPLGSHWAAYALAVFAALALLSDLIAGSKPLMARGGDQIHFPVFESWLSQTGLYRPTFIPAGGIWKKADMDYAIWPLITYGPEETNVLESALLPPFTEAAVSQGHWLGTDALGRDVLSGLLQGARYSLGVALLGMSCACLLGLALGVAAGWWNDRRLRASRWSLGTASGGAALLFLQLSVSPNVASWSFLATSAGGLVVLAGAGLAFRALVPRSASKPVMIPVDSAMNALLVLLSAFPVILLVLALSVSLGPGLPLLVISLTALGWPLFALISRSETRSLRQSEFMQAGVALGLPELRLLSRQLLPQMWPRLKVVFAFGVAQAVLIESALSYLGLGIPLDRVSWGSMISSAQSQPGAWWLVAFPGAALLTFVSALMSLSRSSIPQRV